MFAFDNYIFKALDDYVPGISAKKDKEMEKFTRFIMYLRAIIADALSMFDMDDPAPGLDFRMLELYRYCNGHCCIMRSDKWGVVAFPGSFTDELNAYGRGTHYVGALLNGEPMECTIGKDGIIIYNNFIRTPDLPLFYSFARRLAEVDTSLDMNVLYSRLAPIVKVRDGKIKEAVDTVLNNIAIGGLKSIIADDIEGDVEGVKSIDILNITDVDDVDKLQYLSKYHDDLLRRLYTYGGHAMAGTQKMAQQSSDEISQNDTISMIYPMERLKCLSEAIAEANEMFGTNMSVHFSEPWTVAKEKIETSIANANQIQAGDISMEEQKQTAPEADAEKTETKNEEDNKDEV